MRPAPLSLIVLTAPSGAGKTTLARRVMEAVPGLVFSVSATTRPPRAGERDGVDYHFLSPETFQQRLAAGDFLEHEEVYPGRFYGTLRPELEVLAQQPTTRAVVLDVDVKGAATVKRLYGDDARTMFVEPPSMAALAERLRARGTESEDRIAVRLARAEMEMAAAPQFDCVVVNDVLDVAVAEAVRHVEAFLSRSSGARAAGA